MENKKKTKSIIIAVLCVLVVAAVAVTLFVFVIKPANQYKQAAALRDSGEYEKAAIAFAAIEDYKDAADQVLFCKYKEAERMESQGRVAAAAMVYGALGDYEDSRARSFALWDTISVRKTVDTNQNRIIALKNDGSIVAYTRAERKNDKGKFEAFYPNENQTNGEISNIVDISAGYFEFYALRSDGILYEFDHNGSQPVDETWTDIVAVDSDGGLMSGYTVLALRSDGTVVAKCSAGDPPEYGQELVEGWRNIVAISCSTYISVGLRANGTVITAGYLNDEQKQQVHSWTDIVAVEAGSFHVVGLKADGTVVYAGDTSNKCAQVTQWENVIALGAYDGCSTAITGDGKVLYAGDADENMPDCAQWTDVTVITDEYGVCFGLKSDGTLISTKQEEKYEWFDCSTVESWNNIKQPEIYAFYNLDPNIEVDAEAEQGTFVPKEDEPFTNKYGTPTTTCAHANCAAYIANSGDTNCCPWHSNRCGNCRCYIDEDAMYCMDCIKSALD